MPTSLEPFMIHPGVAVVPRFASEVLGFDPGQLQDQLEAAYPVRHEGDAIQWGAVQWVAGDNAALKYRGRTLKRGKIWLQRGDTSNGYRRYFYTGWQWKVLPATADVELCKEVAPIAAAYDRWCDDVKAFRANHYIITRYEDGQHNIGFHFDKDVDIESGSLITVVKTGHHGRPFELRRRARSDESQDSIKPFFSQVLEPGTAVIMTLAANLATQHGVPVVEEECGASGSIVFRSITKVISPNELIKRIGPPPSEVAPKRLRDEHENEPAAAQGRRRH